MRILIAEDERITRASLARQLQQWGHAVVASEDGETAWERFKAEDFDLVITDWEMPRLSGLELIQRIRETPAASYVYVIMLTSRSDKADVVRGIEIGADDFLCKPFDREELRVRLLAGTRIVNLERALQRQNAVLRDANERIRHGLRAAARVQQSMLPRANTSTPQVRTAWKYVPTEELAGDAVGLHLIDDRYLVAYVIDVSGHGVPAALLSVTAMHEMEPESEGKSVLRDMTAAGGIGTVQWPARVAAEMNRRFRASDYDGLFLTMVLSVLDTRTGRFWFTSAGHPPPIVLRGEQVIPHECTGGFPIAILDGVDYEDVVIQLAPGDRVFLYSDGLPEQSEPAAKELFGNDRLVSLLQEHHRTAPDAAVGQIIDAVARWGKETSFADDVSLVLIEWLGPVTDPATRGTER